MEVISGREHAGEADQNVVNFEEPILELPHFSPPFLVRLGELPRHPDFFGMA
jgi:hypothetical protein